MSGDGMSVEPDAWATFSNTYNVMDDLDADEEFLIVEEDTHKEPLYSGSTVAAASGFEEKADDLEWLQEELAKEFDSEEVPAYLVEFLYELEADLRQLEEVFNER